MRKIVIVPSYVLGSEKRLSSSWRGKSSENCKYKVKRYYIQRYEGRRYENKNNFLKNHNSAPLADNHQIFTDYPL